MLNSDPATGDDVASAQQDADVRSGATDGVVLAGLATALVVAIWLAFYLLVFVPRAITP